MTIRLGTNIQSVQAQRRLGEAAERTGDVFRRLASGQRITSASDDAAGLAIADALASKTRVFTQGVRNLNDGVSALTVADSAVETLIEIATRIKELAEQGANGTYSHRQRAALDKEAQLLRDEFTRVTLSTSFNGLRLFDGSVQGVAIQAGYGSDGAVVSSLGGKMGTGGFEAPAAFVAGGTPTSVTQADFNGDGKLDLATAHRSLKRVSLFLGNGDSTFGAGIVAPISAAGGTSLATGDFNGDGVADIAVTNDFNDQVDVILGNGDGSFTDELSFAVGIDPAAVVVADVNSDGRLDLITANSGSSNASVLLGNGDGTFTEAITISVGASPGAITTTDLNNDGRLDFVTANSGASNLSVLLGNGDGTFQSQLIVSSGSNPSSVVTADFNGDGNGDIAASTSSTNNVSIFLGTGTGTFGAATNFAVGGRPVPLITGDFNGDGVSDLVAVGTTVTNEVSLLRGQTRDGIHPLLAFSLRTQADSKQALSLITHKLHLLSEQRGQIGAFQSRLLTATQVLSSQREGFAAADARIRDADIGAETAELARSRILQQSAAAIMAQANQQPALALQLLRG